VVCDVEPESVRLCFLIQAATGIYIHFLVYPYPGDGTCFEEVGCGRCRREAVGRRAEALFRERRPLSRSDIFWLCADLLLWRGLCARTMQLICCDPIDESCTAVFPNGPPTLLSHRSVDTGDYVNNDEAGTCAPFRVTDPAAAYSALAAQRASLLFAAGFLNTSTAPGLYPLHAQSSRCAKTLRSGKRRSG
jgi:hypothetical protein